jgi:hypothetical protein
MSNQHQHRAPAGYLHLDTERVRVRPWRGCVQVGYDPNQAAHSEASHGAITIQVTCTCGWERLTEANSGHRKHGPWYEPTR